MRFTDATLIQRVVDEMKTADIPRSDNRSKINLLFNGAPPYSDQERVDNKIETNVNFLEATKIAHDARRQFLNAFLKPGNFFVVTLDYGPIHKRKEWSSTITKELNRCLKQSLAYTETLRSTFASTVLHGIGPCSWENLECVVPYALSVDDVMIPARTLLTMENLEFFAVYRQYTPARLFKLTHGPKVDPAWNVKVVDSLLAEIQKEVFTNQLVSGSSSYESMSPEKIAEAYKEDSGFYASDAVPTVDLWDFFFWNDENKRSGWNRRIIIDGSSDLVTAKGVEGSFIYDPGDRVYSDDLAKIIHFQFGDASAVAPFRYHSVRSLGFLLYSICHLQNRLRSRFNDHVFTQLLEFFKARTSEDAARVQKCDMINKGVIPEGIEWVKASDRYQVNVNLINQAMQMNRDSMADNSASYTQDYDFSEGKTPETATETMAKVNAATALVSSMLTQAYNYQVFQYREIARRFCIKNSRDKLAREFRNCCLKSGVPEEALDCSTWNIEAERVLGAGNKTLEVAQAKELMAMRPLFDPEPQREVLHDAVLAVTDDPERANRWVPLNRKVISDSFYTAQAVAGTLMQGLKVDVKTGLNHIEYVEALMQEMLVVITKIEQRGGMATPQELEGLQNMASHIAQHIAIIAQDPNEKQRVRQYSDDLGNMANLIKGYAQRLQQMQAKQGGNGQGDPQAAAKAQAMMIQAQTKAQLTAESHRQRTAQRQAGWEMEERRKDEQHKLDMARQMQDVEVDNAATDLQTAAEIRREGVKNTVEMKKDAENET